MTDTVEAEPPELASSDASGREAPEPEPLSSAMAAGRLAELSVRDLALIEKLRISFEPGLNVLTGETGAGKSLLIDALGLAVGARGLGVGGLTLLLAGGDHLFADVLGGAVEPLEFGAGGDGGGNLVVPLRAEPVAVFRPGLLDQAVHAVELAVDVLPIRGGGLAVFEHDLPVEIVRGGARALVHTGLDEIDLVLRGFDAGKKVKGRRMGETIPSWGAPFPVG